MPAGPLLKEGRFSWEGFSNFFLEGGEGESLLFLHPLGGSTELWEENIPSFLPKYHVLALDFLGCGRSDRPDVPYKISDLADQVLSFLDDRKVDRATLIGNSLGGHVALYLASSHAARISRLVLANPSGLHAFPRPALARSLTWGAEMLRHSNVDLPKKIMSLMLKNLYGANASRAQMLAIFYAQQMKGADGILWKRAFVRTLESIFATPLDDELPDLHVPTLILWGVRDHLLGKNGGKALAQRIPGAKLIPMEETGHFPQLERPEKFNEIVAGFLEDTQERNS